MIAPRFALRALTRHPAVALLAVITLALGIGANTAIFSVVNAVLLRPLPFHEPERLVFASSSGRDLAEREGAASYPDFKDWKDQAETFEALAAFWTFPKGDVNLTGGSEPIRASVARITPGFFETLGVILLLGRTFQTEETVVGNHRRVILSHGLWQRHFAGDRTLVGRSVQVNGFPYTVVGIMPPDLPARGVSALGTGVDLWRPLVPEDNQTGGRDNRILRVIGRLAPGVSAARAEARLDGIASRLAALYPETNRNVTAQVAPLRERIVLDARRALLLLLSAVAVVLLCACVNVASLLLMKAAATVRQVAVQHALGASHGRLAGQVLLEGLLLALAGAGVGLLIAYGGIAVFMAAAPPDIPLLTDTRIDQTVLAFTLMTVLATVMLVALVPAWRLRRLDAMAAIRKAGGGARGGDERRVMRGFTVAQTALAMTLLATGGLLLRSFQSLLRVDPGLNPEHVLSFQLELPMGSGMPYSAQPRRDGFFLTLLDGIRVLPGVRRVTYSSAPPLVDEPSTYTFSRSGSGDTQYAADFRLIGTDYFALLEIPVLEGRGFDASDVRGGKRVVVVSKGVVAAVWGAPARSDPRSRRPGTRARKSSGSWGMSGAADSTPIRSTPSTLRRRRAATTS